jgi:hypothetical protein
MAIKSKKNKHQKKVKTKKFVPQCKPDPIKLYFRKNTWKDIVVRPSDFNDGAVVMINERNEVLAITTEVAQYFVDNPKNFYEINFHLKHPKDE